MERLWTPRELVVRFNPNHGQDGRFAHGAGAPPAGGYTYDGTSPEQRMDMMSWGTAKRDMTHELALVATGEAHFQSVQGELNAVRVGKVMNNAREELNRYGNYLAGDTMSLMHAYVNTAQETLTRHVGEFKGVNARDMDAMMRDSVRKLVYQEVESNRQQFTDHGIRHIVKNVQMQSQVMDAMEKDGVKFTGRDRLLGQFIMVNHDVGYTHPMIRAGGLSGVKATGEHPAYGEKVLQEQEQLWDQGKVFTKAEYDHATHTVATHSTNDLDMRDPLAVATRIADNSALFQREKLPSVFAYVPGARKELVAMGEATRNKDDGAFAAARGRLGAEIDKANFSPAMKRDLHAAVGEISPVTPKYTLGVLAGSWKSVRHGGDSVVSMTVQHNKYESFLQEHFDMGQGQLKKLLTDYGVTDFTQKRYSLGNYNGKPVWTIEVT